MEQARSRSVSDDTSRLTRERQRFIQISNQALGEINNALEHDENDERAQALQSYEQGVRLMEEALAIDNTAIEMSSDLSSKREKMITTLSHAKSRVTELTHGGNRVHLTRQTGLPSYEEAISPTGSSTSSLTSTAETCNAQVILEISTAQVYFITSEGFVSAPSYPSPLRICRFITQTVPGAPEYFLQIGDFTLPLLEDLTPSLHTANGAYIFPDVTSTQQGAAVGIVLDDRTPAADVETFESLVADLCALRTSSRQATDDTGQSQYPGVSSSSADRQPPARSRQPPARPSQLPARLSHTPESQDQDMALEKIQPEEPRRLSTKIGKGLTTAAGWVSWGLEKGAEGVGGLMSYGGAKIRANMQPPAEERTVDPSYRQGVVKARYVSNKAVVVSKCVVKALGDMTVRLGKAAAPYIKAQAKQLLPEKLTSGATAKDESGRSKMDDIAEVAAAGVRGFGVIYLSLEEAGKALGRVITTQTSAIMCQKYGEQYGEVTEHAMYSVGNTLIAAHNIKQLGPKALAKRAAKDTAKEVVTKDECHAERSTLEITDVTEEESSKHKT